METFGWILGWSALIVSCIPALFYLFAIHAWIYIKKGAQRSRWQTPLLIGFIMVEAGYFAGNAGIQTPSWGLYIVGCLLSLAGGIIELRAAWIFWKIPLRER